MDSDFTLCLRIFDHELSGRDKKHQSVLKIHCTEKILISCSWIFLNNPTVTLKQNITQLRLKGNKMKFTFTVEEFKDKSIVLWQKTSVHWNWSSSSIETDRPVTFIPRWNKMMNGRAGKMDLSPLSMLSAQSLPIEDLQSAS